ncbi:hypothetical protein KSF73_16790 [Burkholderiaceae bacterium DAT-1]|nr:hypothetical protein [Burkholderiaceae bacterium DAT-1]
MSQSGSTTHTRAVLADLESDPFAPRDWDSAPPTPTPAPVAPVLVTTVAPPPPPVEPPIPFQYMGRMRDEHGATVVYFARGQDTLISRAGDMIDGHYKLISVDDSTLVIEYLPMNNRHEISLDKPQ